MARQKKSNNKAAKLAASRGKVPAIPPIFRMMGNAMGEQARLPMAVRASPQNQLPDAAEMSSSTEGNNQEQVCTCDKGHHHDEELDDEEDYEEGEEEAEDEEERDEDEEEDEELEDEEEDYPEYVTLREERAGTPHPHASSHEEPPPQTPPRPVAKAKYRTTTARPTSLPPPKTPPCTPPDTPDTEDGEEVLELKMDPLVRDAYLKAGILQHFEGLPEGLNEMASKIASMKPSELLDCLQTLKPVEYDRLLEKFANAQKQKKEEMPECGRLVFTHTHEVRDPKELAKMQRMMDQHKRLLKQNDALRAELEATQAEVARERLAAEMRKKSAQVGKKAEDSRKGKIRSIPTSNLKPGSSSEFDKKMADFADRASKAVMSEGMAGAVGGTAVSGQKPINPWASIDGDLSEGSGLTDAECSAFIARLRESRASGVPITPDGRALPGEVKALVDLVRQNPERHDTLLRDLQRLHHQPPANPSVHPMWLPTPEQMTSTAKSTKRAAEAAPPTLATITKEGRAELKKNAHAIMVSYLEHPNDAARAAALCQLPLSTLDDIDSDEEEALMQVLLDRMKQSAANGQSEVPEAYPGMLVMPEPPPGWTPSSPTFPDIPGFPFDPAKMDPTAYAYLDELIKRNPALYSMQPPRPTAVPQYPSGQVPYHQWAYPGYAQMPPPHPMSYAPPTPQQQAMGYGYPYGYYAVQSPAWHYVNGNLVLGVPNYPTVRHVPIFESVVTDVPDTIASGNIPLDPVTGLPKGAKVVTSIKGTMAIPVTGYPSNDFNDDIERPLPMEMDAYNARMERAMRTITANREAAMGVFKSHSQSAPTTPTPSSEASCKVQSTEPLTTNEMIERIFGTQAATATSQQQRTAVTIPPLKEGEVHAPHFGGTVTGDGIYNPMCNHVYDGTGVCVHCHRVIIFDPFPTDTSLGIRPPPMSATGVYIGQTQGYAFLMDNPGVPAPESVLKDPVELQKYQQIYNKTIEKIVPPGHQSMMYDSNLMPEQLGHFVASTGGVLSEPFDPATLPPFLRGGQQPTEMDANCRYFYSTAAAHGNLPPPEGGTMAGAYAGLSGLPPSMTKITSVRRAPSYVRQDIRAFPRMITPTPGHVKMLIGKLDIPDAESSTSYGQDPLNYEKGTVLGTGSYSAVYPGSVDKTKAANKADVEERTVAIKIVSMTDFAKYKDLKMLLDNEKHALHMCRNHPAVVQIEGFVESHGEAYLIFERMACDLTTYVFEHMPMFDEADGTRRKERRMLTEPTTKLISKQVLSALHYLHPKGIVHGDIRPPNVLVGERSCDYPQVKLCDFGHVRLRNGKQWSFKDLDSSTAGKARPRNRGYEAPESYDIIGFSAELDMYGLGTLAHFCLTGRPPYDPNGGSDSPATPKKDTAAPGAAPGATGTAPASTAKDKKNRRIVQRDHLRAKLAETKKAAAAASPGDKGFPPFDPVDFMAPGSVWESSISQDGRDWCESLLRHDPSQRMTRLEASHHSWINTKDCYKYGRRLETRLGIFRPSERHLTSLADDRKFMMVRLSPVKAPPATAAPETPKPTPKAPANTPRKAEPPRHPAPKR